MLKYSQPNSVALFVRDIENLSPQVQTLVRMQGSPQEPKRVYAYEVDFHEPLKITSKTHQMLRNLNGRVDHIFFCHGVIHFMAGIDGRLPDWDAVQKINVRSTMQILSICMPFLRMTKGSATVLSSSAGEKPWPGHTIFNAAMVSLNMMVRCAALENAHHQVRINAVAPGYVRSEKARTNPECQNFLSPQQNNAMICQVAMATPLFGH